MAINIASHDAKSAWAVIATELVTSQGEATDIVAVTTVPLDKFEVIDGFIPSDWRLHDSPEEYKICPPNLPNVDELSQMCDTESVGTLDDLFKLIGRKS